MAFLRYQLTGDPSRRDEARAESRRLAGKVLPRGGNAFSRLRASSAFSTRTAQIGDLAAMRERAASAATP